MDGETNGNQEDTQGARGASQQQDKEKQETQRRGQLQIGGETSDCERRITERNEKSASLEAQVIEAAKNAETVEMRRFAYLS